MKRVAEDGVPYTEAEFNAYYGPLGAVKWASAQPEQRFAEDGQPYTEMEFVAFYGSQGMEKWAMAIPTINAIRNYRKPTADKAPRALAAIRREDKPIDWTDADPDKWSYREIIFSGAMAFKKAPETEEVQGTITSGLALLKEDPVQYEALFYQTSMTEWPDDQQHFTLIKRKPKTGMKITFDLQGPFTYVQAKYQALASAESVPVVPDNHTDTLLAGYKGYRLAEPLRPGRGQGCADVPGLKIMANIDPNDVAQGDVGNCWLLSAISALAEYDGAIAKIFKTHAEGIHEMPHEEHNTYNATLFELSDWSPVEVAVDERLCSCADGSVLLGAHPTLSGELWVCYLEKAIAAHCGGWDQISGGQCTHAWSLLLGCKECYTFKDFDGCGFQCFSKFNPNDKVWEPVTNSPHGGFRGLWPSELPKVGGGSRGFNVTLSVNALFEMMCEWDDANYIMAAGTKDGTDTAETDGIVDGHAYTVLECVNDVAGTDFDLIKVRNPWGRGEFSSGFWDDDGPGWAEHPEVKAALNPVAIDDGVFWLSKEEFFAYFPTLFLCAKDMTAFLED